MKNQASAACVPTLRQRERERHRKTRWCDSSMILMVHERRLLVLFALTSLPD